MLYCFQTVEIDICQRIYLENEMSGNRNVLNQLNELNLIKNDKQILPERRRIISIIKLSQVVLFPDFYHYSDLSQEEAYIELEQALRYEIRTCLAFDHRSTAQVDELTDTFLNCLPLIKKKLLTDIQAIYDGDPAAKSKAEVLLCYPGFYATNIYRIAHELYRLSIPYIPRIMSEYAHEKTGIDINPGAVIDEYFCIDHGTGIVIGETATIGHHVKLYQGVTIGAKSFDLDENGNPLKSGKRHPDIGNYVVIYANATILGGDTVVGSHSIIGGNTWLLHSVEEGSKIYYR